jgi:carbamoyltransferase
VFDWKSNEYEEPFKFMTMTVNVKDNWKSRIPAVTHIDGTARPQIIEFESNKVVWELLDKYFKSTGIPCLVNTSFNVHEEPIVYSLENALSALDKKMIDVLYFAFENKWFRNSN